MQSGFDGQQVGETTFGGVANWDRPPSQFPVSTDEFLTFMREEEIRLPDGGVARKPYLDHEEFVYFLRLENLASQPQQVTIRVFIAPSEFAFKDRRTWIRRSQRGALPANTDFLSSVGAGVKLGTIAACDPPNPGTRDTSATPAPYGIGPIEKTFAIPTLKQTWTPEEVNDPSFGAGLSFSGRGFSPTPAVDISLCLHIEAGSEVLPAHSNDLTVFVNCVGIAVYYMAQSGGGGTSGLKQYANVFAVSK